MLNKSPIFIVGLSRGGSSILLNILRSHPDLCSPRGETHQVFYGKPDEPLLTRLSKLARYLPIMLTQQQHVFSPHNCKARKSLLLRNRKAIDKILFEEKLLARDDTQNKYRSEGIAYSDEEIRRARLLCKNIDGLAFATQLFADIYPDAVFFGLVRNGLAVSEGHIRRGMTARQYGQLYVRVCTHMIAASKSMPNFHVVHYENLTKNTILEAKRIFELADLDEELVSKFRLIVGNEGDSERTGGSATQLRWYTPYEFAATIAPDVNEQQINRLSSKDRDDFLKVAGHIMTELGYTY